MPKSRKRKKKNFKSKSKKPLITKIQKKLPISKTTKNSSNLKLTVEKKEKNLPIAKHFGANLWIQTKKWTKLLWIIFGGIGVIMGVISGYKFLTPNVAISASSTPLNPSDPFSTRFFVSNNSQFPIYDVSNRCYFGDMNVSGGISFSNFSTESDIKPISIIEAGEKDTTLCILPVINTFDEAQGDIYMIVSFQPSFSLFFSPQEKMVRFAVEQGSDKKWYWRPIPLSR